MNIMHSVEKSHKALSAHCTEVTDDKPKYWTPPALRAPVLIFTIAICWALIVVLEYLLFVSRRDSGLIFAPIINDLPLRRTFLYLYFPTILAVVFSIYWAWIDLETKRMEPYYQLSKKDGALGKDSLLLQYPFSFIPFVPFRALRDRHWPVFWASLAVVLVTWGLVPTQAGIFSIEMVARTISISFNVSDTRMPFEDQAMGLTMRYAQSGPLTTRHQPAWVFSCDECTVVVRDAYQHIADQSTQINQAYGIVALNETLPPFMARNYTLAPFKPRSEQVEEWVNNTYTAATTMYTLDLYCEEAKSEWTYNGNSYEQTASNGCTFNLGLDGNTTIGIPNPSYTELDAVKEYNGMYVGYHNGGFADYYLSSYCPRSENTTFYAAFDKSKLRVEDPPEKATGIFCQPRYWRQEVLATVEATPRRTPLKLEALADKQPLEWDVFNRTYFESMLNSGSLGYVVPGDVLPIGGLPKYRDVVSRTNITSSGMMPMVGFALATTTRPLNDYLDWQILSKAYADAYRLIFARAMVDVLDRNFTSSKEISGTKTVSSQALVLEPIFVHIVVGLLAVVSVATAVLLYLSLSRKRYLHTDPSTLASIMPMVADDQSLLADFADLDCCTLEDVQNAIGQRRYKLEENGAGSRIVDITPSTFHDNQNQVDHSLKEQRSIPSKIAKPVRPVEFSLWVAIPFVNLFVGLAVVLGILYGKAYTKGLPLPSNNTVVQNILENYIPTAIATLIEPMWILINRLFCLLQPLEELHSSNARASRSVDTDYSSLPPQLVIIKALKSKHFVLVAVCVMALLANVLAVAFAGLFLQKIVDIRQEMTFQAPYQFKFVPVNGSVGPQGPETRFFSGAYRGGEGHDHFYIAESNYTRNSSLPAWTDEKMLYLPMFSEKTDIGQSNSAQYEGTTRSVGAVMNCEQIRVGKDFEAGFIGDIGSLNVTIKSGSSTVRCREFKRLPFDSCAYEHSAWEMVSRLQARPNATRHESDVCMGSIILGWARAPQGSCPSKRVVLFDEGNALYVRCTPKLVTGTANIRVNAKGILQQPGESTSTSNDLADDSATLFSTTPIDIIGQSNGYIFPDIGGWHNNSFGESFINHFMIRASDRRIVDPSQPVPTLQDIMGPLNKAYSKLFAVWLGRNKELLLVSVAEQEDGKMKGTLVQPAKRIFLSTTMFIISEAILCTYVLVAVWVYAHRPGQYLPRLPTSIAAVIALFAASSAVQDMRGTSHLDKKGRAQHLERIGARYGYGSYIGADGRVHIGLEKTPFVKSKMRKTWLERKLASFRKGSLGAA